MIRIGIIGTGRIAGRFISECKEVTSVKAAAIYNPRLSSAVYFAEQNGISGSDIIITDDIATLCENVDAVYVASPHEYHYSYTKQLLENGKHVLCEKPFVLSANEARELFTLASLKHLVCMEAVKTACCPGFEGLLSLIEAGVIGKVCDVEACFSKIGSCAGREIWGEYGGAFTELGSYPLLPAVKLLGTDSLSSSFWSKRDAIGTDSFTKLVINYEDATATIKTGLGVKSEGSLIISGEKGYIRVEAPWWLTKRIEVHHEDSKRIEVYEYPFEKSGLRYEIAAFAERITYSGQMCSGVTPDESIWMATQMEAFLGSREKPMTVSKAIEAGGKPKIWAHRGCSMEYPENTLLSFKKAAQIPGITGIELDIQLTYDGEMVVIHDEKLDRTTNGTGYVKDCTLSEIKKISITPSGRDDIYCLHGSGESLSVPTLKEVFDLLKPYCQNGFMINIELKNSVIRYEGMEQKVIDLVSRYGLQDNIVYSSFNHESMGIIKEIDPAAQTGMLADDVLICLEGLDKYNGEALHPKNAGLAINPETVDYIRSHNIPVRMWNSVEPLFGQSRELGVCDLNKYVAFGVTDIITNVPGRYLE